MSDLDILPTVELGFSTWPDYKVLYHLRLRMSNAAGQPTIVDVNISGIKRQGDKLFTFNGFPWIAAGASVTQDSTTTDANTWQWVTGQVGIDINVNPALYSIALDYATAREFQIWHEVGDAHTVVAGVSRTISVWVPQYKRDQAALAQISYVVAWGLFATAVWWWFVPYIAGPAAAAGGFALTIAIAQHGEALGCARFRDDWATALADPRDKLRERGIEDRPELAQFKAFVAASDEVLAIRDAAVDTRDRYLSALKMKDSGSAARQRQHLSKLRAQSQGSLGRARAAWAKAEAAIDAAFVKGREDPGFSKCLDKLRSVRERGFSTEDRAGLTARGLGAAQIDQVERCARAVTVEELSTSPSARIRHLLTSAEGAHDDTAREHAEVETLDAKLPNDQLRALERAGLIDAAELAQRRDQLERETSYPVWEVWAIGVENASKLVARGIGTTADLLARCRKESDRAALAEELGVAHQLVDRWTVVATLLQIEGLGIEDQALLEQLGVRTASELARQNKAALHDRLAARFAKLGQPGREPRPERVEAWIAGAAKLPA